MTLASIFRLFWLISAPRVYFRVALGFLAVTGVGIEFVNTGSSDFAIVSILLVQLFAASTGFIRFSSRGYYDPVLISGASRPLIGGAHFLASVLPGVIAWVAVGLAQVVFAKRLDVMAFRPTGWVALLLVSTIPWALSIRLPPLSGGAIWLTVSIAYLVSRWGAADFAQVRQFVDGAAPFWRSLRFLLAVPLMLPGAPVGLAALLALAGIGVVGFVAGLLLVSRAEFALVEEVA